MPKISTINLSIIIISYNVKPQLIKCYNKIIKFRLKNTKVFIIDNNSSDGSYEAINKIKDKNTILVKNNTNIGFAKGVNQGIKLAKSKFVLLLNPDTTPNINALHKLITHLENHKKTGLVGGRMTKPKSNKIHGTFVNKPNFLTGIFEFTNLKKIFPNNIFSTKFYYKNIYINKPKNVWGLSGGFLMFKKTLIDRIGLFDENFFMYLEDVDFGIRVRKIGLNVIYVPSASIVHDSGSSSKNSKYKINVKAWRNSRNYFFYKYMNKIEWIMLKILFNLDDFIIDTKHKLTNQPLT